MNDTQKNILFAKHNISADVFKHVVEPYMENNCETRGCLEPWTFTVTDKRLSCVKYCRNHSDKWINSLFINPYVVKYETKEFQTILSYSISFINQEESDNNFHKDDFVEFNIQIDHENNIIKIKYSNYTTHKIDNQITKSKFIELIKQFIKTSKISAFTKQLVTNYNSNIIYLKELTGYQIINKITGKISTDWINGTKYMFIS